MASVILGATTLVVRRRGSGEGLQVKQGAQQLLRYLCKILTWFGRYLQSDGQDIS